MVVKPASPSSVTSHPGPFLEAARVILRCPSEQICLFTDKPRCMLFRASFKPRPVRCPVTHRGSGFDTKCPPCPGRIVRPPKSSIPLAPGPSPHCHCASPACLPASSPWAAAEPGYGSRALPSDGEACCGCGGSLQPSPIPTLLPLMKMAQHGGTVLAKGGRPKRVQAHQCGQPWPLGGGDLGLSPGSAPSCCGTRWGHLPKEPLFS